MLGDLILAAIIFVGTFVLATMLAKKREIEETIFSRILTSVSISLAYFTVCALFSTTPLYGKVEASTESIAYNETYETYCFTGSEIFKNTNREYFSLNTEGEKAREMNIAKQYCKIVNDDSNTLVTYNKVPTNSFLKAILFDIGDEYYEIHVSEVKDLNE